jgi:aryl-alcohol dehydrogenase-like predicted oxidoreductase
MIPAAHALYQYTSSNYETSDRTWASVEAVRQVAKQTGNSPAQVALGWVLSQPGVASAIIGARNTSQLADNLAAADSEGDTRWSTRGSVTRG